MSNVKLRHLYTDGASVVHTTGTYHRYDRDRMDYVRYVSYTFRLPRMTGVHEIEVDKFEKAFPHEVTAVEVERGAKPEKKLTTGLHTNGKVVFDVWMVGPDPRGIVGRQLLPYEHRTIHYGKEEFRGQFFKVDDVELVEE